MNTKVSKSHTARSVRLSQQTCKHLMGACKYFGVTTDTMLTILLDDAFIGKAPKAIMDEKGAQNFYKALLERAETNTFLFKE